MNFGKVEIEKNYPGYQKRIIRVTRTQTERILLGEKPLVRNCSLISISLKLNHPGLGKFFFFKFLVCSLRTNYIFERG